MTPSTTRRLTALAVALLLAAAVLTATSAAAENACASPDDPEPGFVNLWDGVSEPTETGWQQSGPGSFAIAEEEDGTCSLLSQGGLGLLWFTERTFGDYTLRLQWRAEDDTDNSGVFVRFPSGGSDTHNAAISSGYEVQIREGGVDSENQKTGSIYNTQPAVIRNANPAGEWNDYEIRVTTPVGRLVSQVNNPQPPHISVTLNGQLVNEFQAVAPNRGLPGYIGLQNHGTNDAISFRNIRIQPLDDSTPPTTTATLDPAEPDGDNGWYHQPVDVTFDADDGRFGSGVATTEYRVDGGDWQPYGAHEELIYDGTEESFNQWEQVGSGSFERLPDGTLHPLGGLGMLWYPVRDYGDMELRLQWRDARPEVTGDSNSGVFVRFPDITEAAARPPEDRYPCQVGSGQTDPAWAAIYCGHEIQIYDGSTGEVQKTGSVYNFAPLNLEQAQPGTQGEWVDYRVRVTGGGDYTVTIIRDGEVLQEWQNTPGQQSSRSSDPGTSDRQFDRGYVGIQNHGFPDHAEFGAISVVDLSDPEPVQISEPGAHLVEFRSTDNAGNVEPTQAVEVNIDASAPTTTAQVDSDGGGPATVTLFADDGSGGSGIAETSYRIDGGAWQTYAAPEQVLFDGTQESLAAWRQAGPGQFVLQPDGSIRSQGGLGMLWHPDHELGDAAIRLEFRDARTDGGYSNSGVFIRFPWPEDGTCDSRPEWDAIYCGQEIQIYDGPTGEVQKTGSVYNFKPLNLEQARPTAAGEWNDYEIRTVGGGDYTATMIRNGEVINTFVNAPGQQSSRDGDPPTDDRQFASGWFGLQNHGGSDLIEFRNIRIQHLSPEAAAFTVTEAGSHTVEFRSTDVAGNVEPIRSTTFTVGS